MVLNGNKLFRKNIFNTKITEIVNKLRSSYVVTNTKTRVVKNKMFNITGLATTTVLNRKATEIEIKIPSIANLVTNAILNTKDTKV